MRLIVGCRLDLPDGARLLVYPTDRAAYGRLCRLLSRGKKRGGKGAYVLAWEDVASYAHGLVGMLVPDTANEMCAAQLRCMADIFGEDGHLALTLRRRPRDQLHLHQLANLATKADVNTVVTNAVLFHYCRDEGVLWRPSSGSIVRTSGPRDSADVAGVCPPLCEGEQE